MPAARSMSTLPDLVMFTTRPASFRCRAPNFSTMALLCKTWISGRLPRRPKRKSRAVASPSTHATGWNCRERPNSPILIRTRSTAPLL